MSVRIPAARLIVASCLVAAAGGPGVSAPSTPRAEIRALWVDAFHAGIRSPGEIRQLIADAKRLHVNTLFVQVRRRADALYASSLEPPLDDPAYDPGFDALASTVREAHASGIQVHAWINAMPVWRDDTPPRDARHLFNRHGPTARGEDDWLTRSREGSERFSVGYFLDPGHPAARDHLVAVYLDIVRRYQLDGIHFDYIRYPETDERLPRGADVGYNPVSLARFARETGRSDVPAPDDEEWTRWRRQQVTTLVRRISIEARAINPRIKVSAAVIAWGPPPRGTADFEDTAPMQRIFQDWPAWLAEGLLDLAVPMNYAREDDARVREWFDGWIGWEKQHKGGRQLAIGVGGYLSTPQGVLAQIGRARARRGRQAADGISIFSYFSPSALETRPASPAPGPDALPSRERLDFLVHGVARTPGAFERPAAVPPMPWLERPGKGCLAGSVVSRSGAGIEGVRIRVARRGLLGRTRWALTDANGWFGMTNLEPGRWRVEIDGARGRRPVRVDVEIAAGRVGRARMKEEG